MPEQTSPVATETLPSAENSATREQVVQAFNNAAFRWRSKIDTLHNNINPNLEIDRLVGTDKDTPGQKKLMTEEEKTQFAKFRTFQQGVKGLNRSDNPILYESQDSDDLTVSFRNADNGEVIHRKEGLDVSGLIESAKEDVEKARLRVSQSAGLPEMQAHPQKVLSEYQEDLRILEENSTPYSETFPDALNESNPVEKGRITEEARRIWDYPLTRKDTMEGDWAVAKERLQKARLLKIPGKSESSKPTTKATLQYEIASNPISPTTSGFEKPTETPHFNDYGEIINDKSIVDKTSYPDRIKKWFEDLKKSGSKSAGEIVDKIRGLRDGLNVEKAKLDPEIAKKVNKLMNTNFARNSGINRRILLIPIVLLLMASAKDSIATSPITAPMPEFDIPAPISLPKYDIPGAPYPKFDELKPAGSEITTPTTAAVENPPIRGKTAEDPIIETEIKPGQTVRGIIVEALKNASPASSPTNVDQAASIVLWKMLQDNPKLFDNPNLVHPGDKVIIPGTLDKFMEGFNNMDQQRRNEIVDNLNKVANNPEAKKSAISLANELYINLRYSSGGNND